MSRMDELRRVYAATEPAAPQAAAPVAAKTPMEQLQDKYAAQDSLAQSTQGIPGMEQPDVSAPFLNQDAQRAQEMANAEAKMRQMQNLATQNATQFDIEQQLAAETGAQAAIDAHAVKQEEKALQLDQKAQSEIDKEDEQTALTMSEIFQKGSLGQKLSTAIAMLVGGYAQGLTGAAENPVGKFLEKVDKDIMSQRELNAAQRAAARKHALDQIELAMKQAKAKTDDKEAIARINKLQIETASEAEKLAALRKTAKIAKFGTKITDPNQVAAADQESLVRLPDGTFALTPMGKESAKEVRKYMGETGAVVSDIQDLINFTKDKRFYNPVGADKARVQTKIATMIGALRLPITGPGPLTDTEREFLIETIGDPSKFFSLKSNQMTKLHEIQSNIQRRVKNAYSQAGIDIASDVPQTQDDRLSAQGISPERKEQILTYIKMKKAAQSNSKK